MFFSLQYSAYNIVSGRICQWVLVKCFAVIFVSAKPAIELLANSSTKRLCSGLGQDKITPSINYQKVSEIVVKHLISHTSI